MAILFHFESTQLKLKEKSRIKSWLKYVVVSEGFSVGKISIIISDDDKLLQLNKEFLSRDYLTDIITFDYSDNELLSGDIFVSTDRIIENAKNYSVSNRAELLRIFVHGILHLVGHKDEKKSDKTIMREKENHYLQIILNGY